MKYFALFLILTFPAAAAAQELHTFSNGELADAEKINENFQYVLENSSGSSGCSAEQDGSNVVITCADGSRGVLASEGTVVTYPVGTVGDVPDYETLPTGEVVLVDANEVVLGVVEYAQKPKYRIEIGLEDGRSGFLSIYNDVASQSVAATARSSSSIFFTDEACTSSPYTWGDSRPNPGGSVLDLDEVLYVVTDTVQEDVIFRGERYSGRFQGSYKPTGDCRAVEVVKSYYNLLSKFILPEEIRSAVYPVRLEQLP